jgi:hypothetical protein
MAWPQQLARRSNWRGGVCAKPTLNFLPRNRYVIASPSLHCLWPHVMQEYIQPVISWSKGNCTRITTTFDGHQPCDDLFLIHTMLEPDKPSFRNTSRIIMSQSDSNSNVRVQPIFHDSILTLNRFLQDTAISAMRCQLGVS